MSDEDDGEATALEIAHHFEEALYLVAIKTGGRFVEDQHLAGKLDGTRDGNDLLHGNGMSAKFAPGIKGKPIAL
jgi:hypothetical protein